MPASPTTHCQPPRAAARGFTAVELMVTVAVLGVLVALAAPSFTSIMENWRVRQTVEELQSTLYYARSEAIKSSGGISIVADDDGWSEGWKVVRAGSADPLQQTSAPKGTAITLETGTFDTIHLDRWGMMSDDDNGAAIDLSFLLTAEGKDQNSYGSRRLCVSKGGRSVQKKGSESCS